MYFNHNPSLHRKLQQFLFSYAVEQNSSTVLAAEQDAKIGGQIAFVQSSVVEKTATKPLHHPSRTNAYFQAMSESDLSSCDLSDESETSSVDLHIYGNRDNKLLDLPKNVVEPTAGIVRKFSDQLSEQLSE